MRPCKQQEGTISFELVNRGQLLMLALDYTPAVRLWQDGDDNGNTTAVRGGSLAGQRTKQVHRQQAVKAVGSSSSAAKLSRRASRSAGSRTTSFRSPTYTSPTSSFAGGRFGTLIFASVPGSDNLLRAHYDAEIHPLLDSESLSNATRSSAYSNKGAWVAKTSGTSEFATILHY